ncbi:hypothetical protein CRUP_019617 [Coryphaenoides rupestris]|nr:hypothetical protein CRUP_019617 [Coryphaenoides rupestris]
MPSLLVLAGIMEKSGGGGYGADLAAGFGSDAAALLVPPDEEEEEEDESRRALRVALGQLSLLGLGEGEGDGGAPNPGLQDRSSNNNSNLAGLLLPGKGKLSALYDSPPSPAGDGSKGRGCNITECVPVPSSEHVAEIEDVALARREIISAAEHFSMLRASRNKLGISFSGSPPAPLPGHTTIQVRVPYRVVGLVVGPKGSTIKRIQQQTCTYIVTPSRDRDPVFEITGSPSNAERAREEIEAHIAFRTGGLHDHNNENDCLGGEGGSSPVLESRLQQVWGGLTAGRKPLASSYRQNFPDGVVGGEKSGSFLGVDGVQSWAEPDKQVSFFPQQRSKSFGGLPPLARLSPGLGAGHAHARRAHSEPNTTGGGFPGRLVAPDSPPASMRDCMTCFESKVTAALVPCGHNLFCMECAVRICERSQPECPVCHSLVTQAIRIFS